MVNIKVNIAKKGNYGGTRSTSKIKYLVIHYTGNDGDSDESNSNYFKNTLVKTSAHYFVDDNSITQSVPDNYIAWHCGALVYKHPSCRNANSIGIELCDNTKDGTVYPSQKTISNALDLVEYLMKKYNIHKSNVIRHYDVTGKSCPAYWCGTIVKDNLWKTEFWDKIGTSGSSNSNPTVVEHPTQTTQTSGGGSKVTVTLNVLKNGSRGENVKALQLLLNGLGYACGTADGIFGAKTLSAVKQFQSKNSLTVDGIVGANTWKALLA